MMDIWPIINPIITVLAIITLNFSSFTSSNSNLLQFFQGQKWMIEIHESSGLRKISKRDSLIILLSK